MEQITGGEINPAPMAFAVQHDEELGLRFETFTPVHGDWSGFEAVGFRACGQFPDRVIPFDGLFGGKAGRFHITIQGNAGSVRGQNVYASLHIGVCDWNDVPIRGHAEGETGMLIFVVLPLILSRRILSTPADR